MPATATATGRRGAPRWWCAALVTALCALWGVLGTATPASAHAALTDSDPKSGAVLSSAPRQVTLTFSEGVSISEGAIRVLDPRGKRVDTGELLDLCGENLVRYGTPLHSGLPDGTFTVAWRAVSADSHPVSGAFTFSIGAPSKTSVSVSEEPVGNEGPVGLTYETARYLAYGGLTVLVGGAFFVLFCWREAAGSRPVQRLISGGWVTLTGATLLMLLLRDSYTGQGSWGEVFDPGGLSQVIGTKTGTLLVSRLLLLGVAALFLAVLFGPFGRERPAERQRELVWGLSLGGGVLATGVAGTWAMAEHASTGPQPALAMPMSVLHLLAVAVWLGGLATLLLALYRPEGAPFAAVRRFSGAAMTAVAVLVVTGVYQSWRQLGGWGTLTGTHYGRLLLWKLALLLPLLVLAWYSRRGLARWFASTTSDVPSASASAASLPSAQRLPAPVPATANAGVGDGAPLPGQPPGDHASPGGVPEPAPPALDGATPGARAESGPAHRSPRLNGDAPGFPVRGAASRDSSGGAPEEDAAAGGGFEEDAAGCGSAGDAGSGGASGRGALGDGDFDEGAFADGPERGASEGGAGAGERASGEGAGAGGASGSGVPAGGADLGGGSLEGDHSGRGASEGAAGERASDGDPERGDRAAGGPVTGGPVTGGYGARSGKRPPTSGEGPGADRTEEGEGEGTSHPDSSEEGASPSDSSEVGEGDPERAAQLARQRAAVELARRRRERDADPIRVRLRRTVLAEAVLAAAVLLVATLLTGTEPARTEDAARSGDAPAVPNRPINVRLPFDTSGPGGKGTAEVNLDPGRSGANTLHLRLTDPRDRPLRMLELKASLTQKDKDIGPLPVRLKSEEKGHWSSQGLRLPVAGDWELALTLRSSEIEQVTETRKLTIG
ncbi:copper resistance protein CopC [Streptomyces sp. NPDC005438]|uniref:copper resistance protein CopC n=1 Tax=Streptomyces sp. NPDC005438 TaxID=3156880 RepID=UPI00339F071A